MTPVGARSRAPTGVMFSPSRFQGGSALWPPGILPLCFLTFTQLSLVADDCKKLLVESMNAFLEPIRDRRKALDKDPKLVWDMLEAGNAKPAPGPRGIWMRSRKAELYLLEKAGRCLRRRGLSPRTPDLENNDACWRAKPRASRRHVFPKRVSKGLSPFGRQKHSSSLLLNVYATVACRRRLRSSSNP